MGKHMKNDRIVEARRGERGFSLLQLMIAMLIIGVITTFAILSVRGVRSSNRLQTSAQTFAGRAEKARLDALRRHATANLEFIGPNAYEITMDYTGTGVVQTRRFTLEPGVFLTDANGNALTAEPYPYVDFDWRGRATECSMLFRLKNSDGRTSNIQISGSGDITINNTATNLPNVSYTSVNAVTDVSSTASITGQGSRVNLAPCGTSGGSGGTIPPPVSTGGGGCSMSLAPTTGLLTIRRNGGSTATFTATVNGPGTIAIAPDPNLSVTPATVNVTSNSGGTFTFTVRSINKTRSGASPFPVRVSFSSCSPLNMYVKVVN